MKDSFSDTRAILAMGVDPKHYDAIFLHQVIRAIAPNPVYNSLCISYFALIIVLISNLMNTFTNLLVEYRSLTTPLIYWDFVEAYSLVELFLETIDKLGLGIGLKSIYHERLRKACDIVLDLIDMRRPNTSHDVYRRVHLLARRTGGSGDWLDHAIARGISADLETLRSRIIKNIV